MNKNTRQTLPLGRSTKEDNAGLSLLRPKLFTVVQDNYKYFNEVFQNISKIISKTVSPFIARLTQKKFSHASMTTYEKVINIKIEFLLKRPFCQSPIEYRWFNRNLMPWNY